ncbi:MAG TPA: polyribonucleotide nucleotidyltransferase [Nitrospirae bacterium]|nr:polyribonucleotide nucleotidyltransferase [bacterium BMS3Abin06]HDH13303.1 polyribonucleotide nucleotidyltransferase [Nitrospirota bacterium]HDZ00643.1 polyribonucleotide nucleotidyltransferase [Nitrospirota bacterium]
MTNVEIELKGKPLYLETGRFAKQADGSVIVRYGDTVILATAVAKKEARENIDFFPLTIDYQEKAYAAGKIPGGFFKREGRPTEKEVLTSRLIDRPTRPLFPDGFYCETQGIVSVLSFGNENISDILGIIGISAALSISDIPFEGPVGAVRIGILADSFVINPDLQEVEECDFTLVVAGTEEAVLMVEGGGLEISEPVLLEALEIAHKEIKKVVDLQKELVSLAGKTKRSVTPPQLDEKLLESVSGLALEKIKQAINIPDKLLRQDTLNDILKDVITELNTGEEDISKDIAFIFNKLEKDLVRNMILEQGVRVDGRKPDEIRQISADVGILPRAHGSALFVRGETQALAVVTLGTAEDEQRIDALEGESKKAFMLHYNFPPFSVGEVKFLRSAGRREIGHGMLAEKALKEVLPQKSEFPYTIRIVSDILESNGSSSMATVCGGSLALMDAGVPIKAPVAGIAMGLIKEDEKTVVLTDILGLEDHLGDMDFKVTGTESGITAFQMDVKISGVTREIMANALEQAKKGRLYILEKMAEILPHPREALATYAPRIFTMKIKPDKIRDVIGTGGKVIRGIVEETGVKIDIDDTGSINIASADEESAQKAIEIVKGIVAEPELGKVYTGKVKRIVDFGAFVEIFPGTEGLLHISQIADKRIEKVTDVLKEGEETVVKVIEIDKMGRIRLSRKEALKEQTS